MPKPGESITLHVGRRDIFDAPVTGSLVGDFVVAINGVSAALTSFAENNTVGTWRWYQFNVTVPSSGIMTIGVSVTSGNDIVFFPGVSEPDAYTRTDLAGLMLTSAGAVSPASATDQALGDIVQGDSFRPQGVSVEVPLGKISPYGYSDLTDVGWSISGAIRETPDGTPTPLDICTITDAANRLISFGWDTWPTAHNLTGTQTSKQAFIDIQLKHSSGLVLTPLRYSFRIVWQRDIT